MADQPDGRYFWCLKHHRVEDDAEACNWRDLLGPYASKGQAEQALQHVEERNRRLDAEDEAWEGGT